MRGSRYFKALVLAFCGVVTAVACSSDTKQETRGQLMVALQSDMSFPKDVSKIRVQVLVRGEVRWDQTYIVAPDGTTKIPATLAVIAGEEKSPPVEVRVIGIRRTEARTFSKVVTTVPASRIATLRVPIQWLCEGTAREVATDTYETTCEPIGSEETSCVAGTCQKVNVPEVDLPNFDPIEIFGGGQQSGDPTGVCFDTLRCFAAGFDVQPTPDCKVTLPVPAGRELNFAVKTGPNGDGICNATNTDCFVPLDNSRIFGWYDLSLQGGTGSPSPIPPIGGDSRPDASAPAPQLDSGTSPAPLPEQGPADPTPPAPFPAPDFPGYQPLQEGGTHKTFQLPPAVCMKIQQGRAQAIRVSLACQTKTERYPTCGPWSSITQTMTPNTDGGIEPNNNCPEFIPGQEFMAKFGKHGLDTYISAAALLGPRVDEMRRNVFEACRKISQELGGTSDPAPSILGDLHVTEMCSAAASLLRGGAKETDASVLVTRGFCSAGTALQQDCETNCTANPDCQAPRTEERCPGEVGGKCDAQCQGSCAPARDATSVECSGTCEGVCNGTCDGTCLDSAGNHSVDACAGWCQGTCNGSCEGTCLSTGLVSDTTPACAGTCWSDSGSDVSVCSGNFSELACSQPLDASPCVTDTLCASACQAQAGLGQTCTITRAQVYGAVDQSLRNAIDMNLGPLFDAVLHGANLSHAATTLAGSQFVGLSLSEKESGCAFTAQNTAAQASASVGTMFTAFNPIFEAALARFGQGGDGGATCSVSETDPLCDQCAKTSCCASYDECTRDAECAGEMACMRNCRRRTADQVACETECGKVQPPDSPAQLTVKGQAVMNCLQTNCYSQCQCPASGPVHDEICPSEDVGIHCSGCNCTNVGPPGTEDPRWQCYAITVCPGTPPTHNESCSTKRAGDVCSGCTCTDIGGQLLWQCSNICPPNQPNQDDTCYPENFTANCGGCTCDTADSRWNCPPVDCGECTRIDEGKVCGPCICQSAMWTCTQ